MEVTIKSDKRSTMPLAAGVRDENDIINAIDGFEQFPLTELQQSLVNYLRANQDDIAEALGD